MSKIAARLMKLGKRLQCWDLAPGKPRNVTRDVLALAASCLNQDETKGPRK